MTHVKYILPNLFEIQSFQWKRNWENQQTFFFGWNYFFILRIKNASESINIDILQELHAYSIAD